METVIDKQKEFEYKVCRIFKFNKVNSTILQRESSEQMIIDDFDGEENVLSGTICYKNNKDILLVVTKNSEVNHIDTITLKMIKIMLKSYKVNDDFGNSLNKVILATNLPVEIHSSLAKSLRENHKFYIERIGYGFCKKHNLEFTQMY